MSNKEDILAKIRAAKPQSHDMPDLGALRPLAYADPLKEFVEACAATGASVIEAAPGDSIDELVSRAYPEAKTIASNAKGVTIATKNPDTVAEAQELNGTDVGVVRGEIGVAENGCVWIPQTMKERAVCFISEQLVILLDRRNIVSNMHEAYTRIDLGSYGYGCFISGPSKTADIAQALVMGAQAARAVTVVLL